ncbi:MAG: glutaredoxin family protein [bacterium]
MVDKKVIVYSTPTCPFCMMAKNFLRDNKIDFEDIDVSSDREKAQEMVQKSAQMAVPVIDIEGEIIVGFDKERIRKALGL